jgi:DNA-binding Lrp family transcriptional regulator
LDDLDVRVCREFMQDRGTYPLQSDIRQSFSKVADRLGIDEATVRRRITKLRESGFMKDSYVFPNPGLFELRVAHARLDVPRGVRPRMKDDLTRKIKLVQGVWTIANHFGSSMRVVMYFEDEASLRRQTELISRISNCDDFLYREIHFPPCAVELSEDDLELVKSIQTDPSKPYDEIANQTGTSSRMVKRRLERMLEGRALFMIPSLRPRALEGALLAELLVVCESPEAMRRANGEIAAHIDDCLMSAQLGDPEHMLFLLVITKPSRVREILEWVMRRPGVKDAFLDLVEERIEQYEAFGQQLNRKLTQVRRAGGERLQPASELAEWQPQGNVRRYGSGPDCEFEPN